MHRKGGYQTQIYKTRHLLGKLDLWMSNADTLQHYNKDSSFIEHFIPQNILQTNRNTKDAAHRH